MKFGKHIIATYNECSPLIVITVNFTKNLLIQHLHIQLLIQGFHQFLTILVWYLRVNDLMQASVPQMLVNSIIFLQEAVTAN